MKDKSALTRRSGDAGERTWLHLTRSYSPLNIGSDVDVRPRRAAPRRPGRRRAQDETAIKPEVYFNTARRAVPIGLIGIERANFATADGIVTPSVNVTTGRERF